MTDITSVTRLLLSCRKIAHIDNVKNHYGGYWLWKRIDDNQAILCASGPQTLL